MNQNADIKYEDIKEMLDFCRNPKRIKIEGFCMDKMKYFIKKYGISSPTEEQLDLKDWLNLKFNGF